MLIALLIIAAVWALTLLLVVSLCAFAKRGDEALTAETLYSAGRLRAPRRTRGARACGPRVGAAQR